MLDVLTPPMRSALDQIRAYGVPSAPKNTVQALFVRELIGEARSRRKWVHVGRVNSARRWQHCLTLGADSVDGTGLVIERRRVLEALRVIENPQPPLVGLWDKGA